MFPRLLYERLEELGIDFAAIYPIAGLRISRIADDDARRAVCRAFNVVTADYFREPATPEFRKWPIVLVGRSTGFEASRQAAERA